jgi:SOS-response transcriptional repressor LexA
MTAGVTIQQGRCLEAIKGYVANCGYAPTYADLRVILGLSSSSGVQRLLRDLRLRGLIDFIDGKARSIRVVEGPTLETMLGWSKDEQKRVLSDLVAILNILPPSRAGVRSIPVMGRID